jgi:hypothetical protein
MDFYGDSRLSARTLVSRQAKAIPIDERAPCFDQRRWVDGTGAPLSTKLALTPSLC